MACALLTAMMDVAYRTTACTGPTATECQVREGTAIRVGSRTRYKYSRATACTAAAPVLVEWLAHETSLQLLADDCAIACYRMVLFTFTRARGHAGTDTNAHDSTYSAHTHTHELAPTERHFARSSERGCVLTTAVLVLERVPCCRDVQRFQYCAAGRPENSAGTHAAGAAHEMCGRIAHQNTHARTRTHAHTSNLRVRLPLVAVACYCCCSARCGLAIWTAGVCQLSSAAARIFNYTHRTARRRRSERGSDRNRDGRASESTATINTQQPSARNDRR